MSDAVDVAAPAQLLVVDGIEQLPGESKTAFKARVKAAKKQTYKAAAEAAPAAEKKEKAPKQQAAAAPKPKAEKKAFVIPERPEGKFRLESLSVSELFANPTQYIGQTVVLSGWVRSVREQPTVSFVALNDGSGRADAQIVIPLPTAKVQEWKVIPERVATGACVRVVGRVVTSPAAGQPVDVVVEPAAADDTSVGITLLGAVDADYPLAKARIPLDMLRSLPHLRVRTASLAAAARIRSVAAQAIHAFFHRYGFKYVHTPLLTGADCEGGGEMFQVTNLLRRKGAGTSVESLTAIAAEEVKKAAADAAGAAVDEEAALYRADFFEKPVFLTVSGQLNVESYCAGLGKVYTFGPTFRAEHSMTSRHLAEFWMIEPELAFCNVGELMDLAEDFIRSVVQQVLAELPGDIQQMETLANLLAADAKKAVEKGQISSKTRSVADADGGSLSDTLVGLVTGDYHRLAYTDAIWLLSQPDAVAAHEKPIEWGDDLNAVHERWLVEVHASGRPVFIVDWPSTIKSFYMRLNAPKTEDGSVGTSVPTTHTDIIPLGAQTVQGYDLLAPLVGELIGGSQREERPDVLAAEMEKRGMEVEPLQWYLDLRRFGTAPHGGFGLGFERLVMLLTGLQNIRDVIPFPRYPGHCDG